LINLLINRLINFCRDRYAMISQAQEYSQDTRQRLMEAALLAFAEKGFDGVGVRKIAQKAKANPAMIAYHFGSKEGLYEAALRWVISDFSQWLQNMPEAPDSNSPNAREAALSSLKVNIKGLFENLVICDRKDHARKPLHEAAHKLWTQTIADSRSATVDFMIAQIRVWSDRVTACVNILRPDISRFELDAMIINVQGAIYFFHKHFDIIQKMRGAAYSDDDLEKMARDFVDFSLRGIGIPDVFKNEGA
jgi:AcrR family transcriptional regulator